MRLALTPDYWTARRQLADALRTLPWESVLEGGACSEEAAFALADFLPNSEVVRLDAAGNWRWVKTLPDRGIWNGQAPETPPVFVPYINRPDLLSACLSSFQLSPRLAVIDLSPEGNAGYVWRGPIFRWTSPDRRFPSMMNWLARLAWQRSWTHYFYVHSDVTASLESLATFDRRIAELPPWGAVFSHCPPANADCIAAFHASLPWTAGCWDEEFYFYVGDVDYYNRLLWLNVPCHYLDVQLHHAGSQTMQSSDAAGQAHYRHQYALGEQHYREKWGCHWQEPGGRLWEIPYRGSKG